MDLAAGTGKLTRLLQPSGARVLAVEPVAGMREQLRSRLDAVEVLDGTAGPMPCRSWPDGTEAPTDAWSCVTWSNAIGPR